MVEEGKADRRRSGKTTSRNGQAWSLPSHRGQWRTERKKMEENGCEVTRGAPTTLAVKGQVKVRAQESAPFSFLSDFLGVKFVSPSPSQ